MRRRTQKWLLAAAAMLVVACQAAAPITLPPSTSASSTVRPQPTPTVRSIAPVDAVRIALESFFRGRSAPSDLFPASAGSQACEIHGGGPPPGLVIPGACRTEVSALGSGYVVTFTELWDGRLFHLAGEASSGQLATTWSFIVSSAGVVVDESQSGNFPPQYVK